MHGGPQLAKTFNHFPYADPNAQKGGKFSFGVIGTFDGFNPFILPSMRTTARGLFGDEQLGSLVFESLMVRSRDEPFTLYGLIADGVEINDARTEAVFHLNPLAKFQDGAPIKVEDIIFTIDLLREHGRPPFNSYAKRIKIVEKINDQTVRFVFNTDGDRELPLLIASVLPVLPKHAIDRNKFATNGLTPLLGSGPYKIAQFTAGQRVTYKRDENYWGKDLPVNKGLNNFDEIRIEYYRNDNARFESFKKGILDIFIEDQPNRWRLGYNFPAVKEGKILKEEFKTGTPAPMIGFVFNTRRELFADKRVRRALSNVLDFEWINRNLFDNLYERTEGFWDGSELSSIGRPASELERQLLAPYPDFVNQDVLDGTWHPIKTDASGINRSGLQQAWQELKDLGFTRKNYQIYTPTGHPFTFEIMTRSIEEEKIALAYQRSLARIGITVTVRSIDDSQYQTRLGTFDYDMIIGNLSASLSPGNEQIRRWASSSRDMEGSFNYAGVANPAVDALIKTMLEARSKEQFTDSVRALDRVLISGHYYLPLYHLPRQLVARRNYVKHPDYTSLYGYRIPAWWIDESEKTKLKN
ncbi:extracellular solute-binding protein [Bartonella sp. HY329]|nr:extracellular solute-binding protein [Bartonella sp. HY329]UXN10701.1 extracellular solute-binding protein [Bartonella sp. HY328]